MSLYEVINVDTLETLGSYVTIVGARDCLNFHRKVDNISCYEILVDGKRFNNYKHEDSCNTTKRMFSARKIMEEKLGQPQINITDYGWTASKPNG